MTVRGGAGAVAPPVASTLLTASWRWSGERSCAQLIAKQPPHSRLGRGAHARGSVHMRTTIRARSVKRDWRLGPAAAARPEREMNK